MMTQQPPLRPDVFSRGMLELTFRLLRDHSPQLARHIEPLLRDENTRTGAFDRAHMPAGEHLVVSLNAQTIGKVVEALTLLGQDMLDTPNVPSGQLLVMRRLMKHWMSLAEWLILRADPPSQAYH